MNNPNADKHKVMKYSGADSYIVICRQGSVYRSRRYIVKPASGHLTCPRCRAEIPV